MGNLSAGDMMQIIRKEMKAITQALQNAQAEIIKSQQGTIQAKSAATIEKLNEAIEKLAEAQAIKDGMSIFNKVMYAVMGVVLAIFTPVLAFMGLAGAAWAGYAAYITLNEKDNGKMMEDIMTKASEDWGVAWADKGIEKQRENGMIAMTTFMAAVQIIIAIIAIAASFGSASPAVAGQAGATAAAQAVVVASQTASSATATASTSAVTTAASTATNAASSASSVASQIATIAQRLASVAQIGVTIGTSSANLAGGAYSYEGTMMKADAETLKALLKMLTNLMKSDADFLKQLASIEAELDKGVSSILRDEHQTNSQLQAVTNFS